MKLQTSGIAKVLPLWAGTFDPIHHGHLVTAEAVRYRFKVDKVGFYAGQGSLRIRQTKR